MSGETFPVLLMLGMEWRKDLMAVNGDFLPSFSQMLGTT
jgi:hypothetical protein